MAAATILVADDDELLVGLLEHRLSAKGYNVISASDGVSALERIRAEMPDLVVLDAMMPALDGFAVLSRIKSDDEIRDIPVIMLTALSGQSDIVTALDKGAADYLVKPFLPEELLRRITRSLPAAEDT
ncbi:response regulator [Hyphobacterium sp. HN65]|uniref:Response regulator n=1 Tax=Hyphobacterium lacteum TaxID=3116575 RepID=A0ABU7LSB3_9PROT|nr:response regulator [Hyphobacterium sp. HN65]MEE2526812.1 response regulator [Hyphobacterium sp. HN65]